MDGTLQVEEPTGSVKFMTFDELIMFLDDTSDAYWLTGTGEIEISNLEFQNGYLLVKKVPFDSFRLGWSSPRSDGVYVKVYSPDQPDFVGVFVGGDYSLEPIKIFGSIQAIKADIEAFSNGAFIGNDKNWVAWSDLNFPNQGEPIEDLNKINLEIYRN